MNMAIDEKEVSQIVESIGGKENINQATHCVTRLRFALDDEEKVDKEKLESLDLVKGSFSASNQFQVVIGQGTVDKVYDEMVKQTGIGEATKQDVKDVASEDMNPLQRGVKTLADIFIPILPAIVTAGLLLGINNLLTGEGIFFAGASVIEVYPEWSGLAGMISVIANTAFTFLPALIGWSATKRFGGSPLFGIVLGLILVHPDLMSANSVATAETIPTWNLFGLEVNQIGYQGQVLPVLVASYILAKLETWLRRVVPDNIQILIVAPVALLVTGLLSFIIIGPVTFAIANWITQGIIGIYEFSPIIGGLVYGGLYGPLVITGMHHLFLAVDLQLIGSIGGTFLWPMVALSNIAQGSAALAMTFVTEDEKVKGLTLTSGVSAYLGVTEPAMFGVNLRYRYAFLSAITGSALTGAFISSQGVMAPSIGIGGLPAFLSIMQENWGAFFIGMAIAIIIPFVLTLVIGKMTTSKDKQLEEA